MDSDFLKYHQVLNYNDLLNMFTKLIHIGDNAPTYYERNNDGIWCYPLLWIDTSSNGGLKYLDHNDE